jgi:Nucleoside phosphorylase
MSAAKEHNSSDFQVRRIFSEVEAKEIKELQKGASVFTENYPGYDKWIDMALAEVVAGHRVAFGAFKAIHEDGLPVSKLVGSMIIKEEKYGAGVELKNLYVDEDSRKKGCGLALNNAVEKHYSKKRYRVIRTQVPAKEEGTISFLLKCGYRVLITKESAHKAGDYVTELEKELPLKYGGDYFDRMAFFAWLLEKDYNLRIKEKVANTLTFSLEPKHKASDVTANGILQINEEQEPVRAQTVKDFLAKHPEAHIKMIFGRIIDAEAKAECDKQGVLALDEAAILQQFGNCFAYKPADFKIDEIAGTVVVVNGEYLDRVHTVIPNQKFTYFKGGTVGKYLKPNHKVLFLFTSHQERTENGVLAFADIIGVQNSNPDEIWQVYKTHNPLFTEGEYRTFVENKKTLLALECTNLTWIKPISQTELCKIIDEKNLDIDDIGHLYLSATMLRTFENKKVVEKPVAEATVTVKKAIKPKFGIITALPEECASVDCMLINRQMITQDGRQYIIGDIGKHQVVLAVVGAGTTTAATRATAMLDTFSSIESLVMVGIAGGVPNIEKPSDHVRLGDIVVSNEGGFIQVDFVKEEENRITYRSPPRPPSAKLLSAAKFLEAAAIQGQKPWEQYITQGLKKVNAERPNEATDELVSSEDSAVILKHPIDELRVKGQPRVFLGPIGSSNTLLKNPKKRDLLRDKFSIKAIEMEASGIADAGYDSEVGVFVIRGISDYCDGRKNDKWHLYAAVVAAAYAKALIESIPTTETATT